MTLSALGQFPYNYKPVNAVPGGGGVTLSFQITDASGGVHNAYGVDGITIQPTQDLFIGDDFTDLAWVKARMVTLIGHLQLAEAGSMAAFVTALLAQGVVTTV